VVLSIFLIFNLVGRMLFCGLGGWDSSGGGGGGVPNK
jgi:hypothetical protein